MNAGIYNKPMCFMNPDGLGNDITQNASWGGGGGGGGWVM